MRAAVAAAVGVAALVAAAPAAAADPADELTRLAKAHERWAVQHATDYTFRLRLTCFCVSRDPVTIQVRGGRPRGTPRYLRRFDTVEELYARIREEIDRGGTDLDARYGARTGVPRHFDADPVPRAIDDEYEVTVRRMRITRRAP